MGDFNAHSPLWYEDKTDRRGAALQTFIEDYDFTLLNPGISTHQKNNGGTSTLDLAFASKPLANKCEWLLAEDNTWGSDHFPIKIIIGENPYLEHNTEVLWKLNKADWNRYQSALISFDNNQSFYSKDVNIYSENITNHILKAARDAVPQTKKGGKNIKSLPYWDENCDDVIKARNKARNKLNRQQTLENKIEYKRLKAVAQHTLKSKAKNSWANYCNSLDNNTKLGAVWGMSRKMNGKNANSFSMPTLNSNGAQSKNNKDKVETLSNAFAASSSNQNFSKDFITHKNDYEMRYNELYTDTSNFLERENDLNLPFTLQE